MTRLAMWARQLLASADRAKRRVEDTVAVAQAMHLQDLETARQTTAAIDVELADARQRVAMARNPEDAASAEIKN
jgi:hypothetical protein